LSGTRSRRPARAWRGTDRSRRVRPSAVCRGTDCNRRVRSLRGLPGNGPRRHVRSFAFCRGTHRSRRVRSFAVCRERPQPAPTTARRLDSPRSAGSIRVEIQPRLLRFDYKPRIRSNSTKFP